MKLRIEIVAVSSTGDGVRVKGQGKQKDAPKWAPIETCEFAVPSYLRRAYYVGRVITVEVQP